MKRSRKLQKKDGQEPSGIPKPSGNVGMVAETRSTPRRSVTLQATVVLKNGLGDSLKEIANLATVSRNGAGFNLAQPCTVGRLVELSLPMPEEFRSYDPGEPAYNVMGLVQHCNETVTDGTKSYFVGVALIGKHAPLSYDENPFQSYRITGMSEIGLWTIAENENSFESRRCPRFSVALEVRMTLLSKERMMDYKDQGITLDIGANGASVRCSLEAEVGDRIKLVQKEFDFYTIAVVRNRRLHNGLTPTLHLEFLENKFPVDKLPAKSRKEGRRDTEPLSDAETISHVRRENSCVAAVVL